MISQKSRRRLAATAAVALGLGLGGAFVAHAQQPPGAGRQAAEERKAAFKLLGSNFRPLGALLKDGGVYNEADATKRISREIFIAGLLNEVFPDASNLGEPDTKAKPEVWTNRADFDKGLQKLQDDLATLASVNAKEKGLTEPFKVALAAVAQDCKSCHDTYKIK